MKQNILEDMRFKDKKEKLDAIFKEYRIAKFNLENADVDYSATASALVVMEGKPYPKVAYEQWLLNRISKQNNYRLYVYFVDSALIRLPSAYRQLIENDFILENDRHWWEQYYSRSTYYRYKNEAMNAILTLLLSKTL